MAPIADRFQIASRQRLLIGHRHPVVPLRSLGLEAFDRLDRIAVAGLRGTFLCPRN
jgi:hypothetical protein